MIPTGGQDYFMGIVHAHALVTIWMNLWRMWRDRSNESGDKWQEDAMELEWGTVCETLEWENRELDEMSQEERAHGGQHRWIKCSV